MMSRHESLLPWQCGALYLPQLSRLQSLNGHHQQITCHNFWVFTPSVSYLTDVFWKSYLYSRQNFSLRQVKQLFTTKLWFSYDIKTLGKRHQIVV